MTNNVTATAPECIWLQVSDDVSDLDEAFPSPTESMTWCADSICACEVAYVRADLARPLAAALQFVVDQVLAELHRATAKFPTWPTDPLHAIGVLGEEFGELTKAVMQATYEPHKNGPGAVREEALQTAAMALRFLLSLDRYEYAGSQQHQQAQP